MDTLSGDAGGRRQLVIHLGVLSEAQTALTALKFLFDLYKFRRDAAKEKNATDLSSGDAPTARGDQPNPERLEELIRELQHSEHESREALSAAIEKKFPPEQASQVKDDLAAISLLANPPNFASYDYYGLITQYVRTLREIALRTEMFRLRGWQNPRLIRLLPLRKTAAILAPPAVLNDAVHTFGEISQVSITSTECFLTDEAEEVPLTLIIEADFLGRSYGVYSGQQRDREAEVYRLGAGQEKNWLGFEPRNRVEPQARVLRYQLQTQGRRCEGDCRGPQAGHDRIPARHRGGTANT